jgi:HPr kinase/phosphorylase
VILVHGTTVAINGMGVIIMGPPGAGKSDLALRLIDQPGYGTGTDLMTARLVADDQTQVHIADGALVASAPAALAGLLEIRGQGIAPISADERVALALCVMLKPADTIERMPDDPYTDILGIALPVIAIDPSKPSAPARVRAALSFRQSGWVLPK